ncbi:MAG: hypothetical protein AMXMBFR8_12000 [Nevskiales bacterium]
MTSQKRTEYVNRLTAGTLWNALSAILAQGGVFLAHIVLANLVGRAAFGHFSVVVATINSVAGVSQLAMASTATKFVAEFRNSNPRAAAGVAILASRVTRWMGVAAGLALVVAAPLLAESVLRTPEIATSFRVAGGVVLFSVWLTAPGGVLAGLEAFRNLAAASAVGAIAYVGLVPLLGSRLGVAGAVGGTMTAAALRWMVLEYFAGRRISTIASAGGPTIGDRERLILTRFALPAALAGSTTLPALWIATAVLMRQSDGAAEVALASAALSIKNLVVFLPGLMGNVATAVMNSARGDNRPDVFRNTFHANLYATSTVIVVIAVLLWLSAERVITLYGPDFNSGAAVLRIMLWVALFEALGAAVYQVILSHGLMWRSFATIALPRDVLFVALTLVLAPAWGAVGFAAAYAMAWGAGFAVTVITAYYLEPDLFRQKRRTP